MTFPIKKKNLLSIVQSMKGFHQAQVDVRLEQYVTDAISTVDFMYFVAIDNEDVFDNIILDIGAGTGRLGLTSLLLGAKRVIAFEIDENAIQILKENANNLDLIHNVSIFHRDITSFTDEDLQKLQSQIKKIISQHDENCNEDTFPELICIMNPPLHFISK